MLLGNAKLSVLCGALQGQKRLGVELVLTGDEAAIMDAARKSGVETLPAGVSIRHTTEETTAKQFLFLICRQTAVQ